jgi:multidrug efflux system membrane fusion protein
LVPTPAIQRNAQGAFVYVIKSDQTASIRPITPGTTDGSVTAVQGLAPQEVVAVNGFDKLLDGAKVSVRAPKANDSQSAPSGTHTGDASAGKKGGSSR